MRRPAKTRTVLIVDDETPIRESLRRYLKIAGYEVKEAPDFDQALSTLKETGVDVMILDVRLPGRSGLELLEHLRLREATLAALPVMVLTGYIPDATEQARIRRLGASVFFKPQGCFSVVSQLERMIRA
jgi:DNA-binding response OmpR family regulator